MLWMYAEVMTEYGHSSLATLLQGEDIFPSRKESSSTVLLSHFDGENKAQTYHALFGSVSGVTEIPEM